MLRHGSIFSLERRIAGLSYPQPCPTRYPLAKQMTSFNRAIGTRSEFVTVIYGLFLLNINYFDTIGTEIGQFEQAGFIIDGKFLRAGRILFAVPGGPVRSPE